MNNPSKASRQHAQRTIRKYKLGSTITAKYAKLALMSFYVELIHENTLEKQRNKLGLRLATVNYNKENIEHKLTSRSSLDLRRN